MFSRTGMHALFSLLVVFMLLAGCTKQDETAQPSMNHIQGSQLSDDRESEKRNELMDQWKQEYQGYIEKIEKKQASSYEYVMASDQANGLRTVFHQEDASENETHGKDHIKQYLQDSPIFNGYTQSGIHIVAIAQPMTNSAVSKYEDAIHTIRGNNQEMELFETLESFSYKSENEYFAVDVFVEDLFKKTKQHSLNLYMQEQGVKHNPLEKAFSEGELDYLSTEYNRKTFNMQIEDGTWQLFLFDKAVNQPELIIELNGEKIELTH